MKGKLPKHVHRKTAKGKTYYYFDLGVGRVRLPDVRSPQFVKAYQAAKGLRTRNRGPEGTKTFDWLCTLYERSTEFRGLAENSKRLYLRHLGYANADFRSETGRSWPLEIITAEHAITIRDYYANQPGKANAILRSLGAIYAWASKPGRNYVKDNITKRVDLLPTGEHAEWPVGLVEIALEDPQMRLPVGLLYFTGQRISDVVKMGRGNLAQGVLSVTQQKTGTSLRIPLHSRLAAIIEADAPKGAMLFLVNEHGRPLTESGLRQRIQKWAKDRGFSVVPHGLRKNAVNALIQSGCSTGEISAITGQTLQMIEHYAKRRDQEELGRSAILKFEARDKRRTGGERENHA